MDENNKKEIMQGFIDGAFIPAFPQEKSVEKYEKFPIEQIASLGVAFQPLAAIVQKIAGVEGTSGLYFAKVPKGQHMVRFKDSKAFMGTSVTDSSTKFAGQSRLTELPCDPTMLCMAGVLIQINKKLDDIQETQQAILEFLEQKEKAKLKGNLNTLSEVLENYKYNWDNSQYKTNKHIQVQEIKRDAEQSLIFYRGQIDKLYNKQTSLHWDRSVRDKIKETEDVFKDYQLALYLFSFSAFLEIMLLGNYDRGYLTSISNSILKYSKDYEQQYLKIYESTGEFAKSSVQSQTIKALSGLSKGLGKVVSKVPLIRRSQLDENMIERGERWSESGAARAERTLNKLFDGSAEFVTPFVDNINTIDRMYNAELELIIDGEAIYLKEATDD